MRKIPGQVAQLYAGLGMREGLYTKLRWKLCPYETIESYLPKKGVIFDMGSGFGMLANFLILKSTERQVVGIDSSLHRTKVAQPTIGKRPNIKFIKQNIMDFDLPECQSVVMSDFLHHLPDGFAQELFTRIYKNLGSNGLLVIQEVDKRPYWKYVTTLCIDRILNLNQKIIYRPASHWQTLLEQAGFSVETIPAHKGLPLSDVIFICQKP